MREMRGRNKWVRREMKDIGLKMIIRERGRWGRWGEREREGCIEDERKKIKSLQERKETVVACKHSVITIGLS